MPHSFSSEPAAPLINNETLHRHHQFHVSIASIETMPVICLMFYSPLCRRITKTALPLRDTDGLKCLHHHRGTPLHFDYEFLRVRVEYLAFRDKRARGDHQDGARLCIPQVSCNKVSGETDWQTAEATKSPATCITLHPLESHTRTLSSV